MRTPFTSVQKKPPLFAISAVVGVSSAIPLGPPPGRATTSTFPPARRSTRPPSMSTARTAPSSPTTGPSVKPSPWPSTSNESGSRKVTFIRTT
jgi:hypothetical protein